MNGSSINILSIRHLIMHKKIQYSTIKKCLGLHRRVILKSVEGTPSRQICISFTQSRSLITKVGTIRTPVSIPVLSHPNKIMKKESEPQCQYLANLAVGEKITYLGTQLKW